MNRSDSKWLTWIPECPSHSTVKTGETTYDRGFAGFAGKAARPFPPKNVDDGLGHLLSEAISKLIEMCPEDLNLKMSRDHLWLKRDLNRIEFRTESDIQRWFNGWRIMFVEMAIDEANGLNSNCRAGGYTKVVGKGK
jgi:hypothetical protein